MSDLPTHELMKQSPFCLSVTEIDRSRFDEIHSQLGPDEGVRVEDWNNWGETSGDNPIVNTSAGPCLIVYVKDPNSDRMIYGHFLSGHRPDVQDDVDYIMATKDRLTREAQSRGMQDTIVVPENPQKWNHTEHDPFIRYSQMLARIKEMVASSVGSKVEVYLFGQHFGTQDLIKRRLIDRFQIGLDLRNAGLSSSQISDNRANIVSMSTFDNTIYIPEDKAIYLYRT